MLKIWLGLSPNLTVVLIDPNCLATLGKRELYEGMGEVIKCGLIADAELWDILQGMTGDVDNLLDNAEALIYHSCDVVRKVVGKMSWIMAHDFTQFWAYHWACSGSYSWLWQGYAVKALQSA